MRTVNALGLASLALLIAIGVYLLPLEPNLVALQFTFSEASFAAVTGKWNASGVALLRSHFAADFALLALYASFGFLLGRRWPKAGLAGGRWQWLLQWSLPVAALADAVENVLHLHLTSGAAVAWQWWYPLAGMAASTKWLGILVFAIAALVCGCKRAGTEGAWPK